MNTVCTLLTAVSTQLCDGYYAIEPPYKYSFDLEPDDTVSTELITLSLTFVIS